MSNSITEAADPSTLEVWLTFIGKVAWPLVVLIIAVTFRANLKSLSNRIGMIEGFGIKADFGEKAAELTDQVQQEVASAPQPNIQHLPSPNDRDPDHLPAELSGSAPQRGLLSGISEEALRRSLDDLRASTIGSIILDWARIEDRLSVAFDEYADFGEGGSSAGFRRPAGGMIRIMQKRGLLKPKTAGWLLEAMALRNRAAHAAGDLSHSDAARFQQLTAAVLELLELDFPRKGQSQ